jgi:hypothetical protein
MTVLTEGQFAGIDRYSGAAPAFSPGLRRYKAAEADFR